MSHHPTQSSQAFSIAEARIDRLSSAVGLEAMSQDSESRSSLATPVFASEEPTVPRLPCGDGSDSAAGFLSGLCQGAAGRGARVPGSPPGGPPAGPAPPDAACCSGRRRLPVSVTLSSARENSMLAPSRRGPHPFTSHPPLPSWQGDWERQLVSSPHSVCGDVPNSPRLITEHLISALPQRGVWGRLEVSVYSILHWAEC